MNVLVTGDTAKLREAPDLSLLRVVFVGHVDHGKSTLIGRLLHETGSLPDGKVASLTAGEPAPRLAFEWSFVLDALQTERDQGITLDTSQVRLRTASRDIVLIDAPGHAELLRNMVTGAAQADAALLLIDASEGVRDQLAATFICCIFWAFRSSPWWSTRWIASTSINRASTPSKPRLRANCPALAHPL